MANWNPWHGCKKISPGCAHCYVYRGDSKRGLDASVVKRNLDFDMPVKRLRDGSYKLPSGSFVGTCFTSDFLLDEADAWRPEAWAMIKERSDCDFLFITKRIHRLMDCLPPDWGDGYPNVRVCCTVENQDRADYRLPLFEQAPIRWKALVCEPLLERIDLSPYLGSWLKQVVAGGESGDDARVCEHEWILALREQCISANVPFIFKQTGAHYKKDGRIYNVARKYQHLQAAKAHLNTEGAFL